MNFTYDMYFLKNTTYSTILNKTTTGIHKKNRESTNTVTLKGKISKRMEMFFNFMMDYVFNSFATTKHFIEIAALCQIRAHTTLF